MKIIPKEKYWFGSDEYDKFYCFEQRSDKYRYSVYNDFKLLSDITVNENNQLHSYNDQPLIYINHYNDVCKEWFINGENKRLNPEKPCLIIKGLCYYLNDGSYFNYIHISNNLR